MRRIAFTLAAFLVFTATVHAQQQVQWISNMEQGISQARQVDLPIMFYVAGSTSGSKDDDRKRAQQATFRDPLIAQMAQARFVPVRLSISTQTKEFLERVGAPTSYGNYLILTTPDLELLSLVQGDQAASVSALASKMTENFRLFRKQLFEKKYKDKLESPDTNANEKISILKTIDRYVITEADESAAKLLEDSSLPANLSRKVYDTLSTLGTQRCVDALLKLAPNDKNAAKALAKCPDGAAEFLLPKLKSEDQEEFYAAYAAIVKICKLGTPKPKGFWSGKNQRVIDEELARVEKGAQRAADTWKRTFGLYR